MTRVSISFESSPCPRCGGAGRLPFANYGGVCFRCSGAKTLLTRNGKRARAKFDAWAATTIEKLASAVTVGERVRPTGSLFAGFGGMGGTFATIRKPLEVLAVEPDGSGGTRITFRYAGPKVSEWLAIDVEAKTWTVQLTERETVRRAPTTEELRALAPTLGKGATLVEREEVAK